MKVFVSYTTIDRAVAEQVATKLISSGIDVWLDSWEVRAGDSLSDRIADGLGEADGLVLVLSSASSESLWVKEELRAALTRRVARGTQFRIVPILLDDSEVPLFLRDYRYVRWHPDSNRALFEIQAAFTGERRKPEPHLEALLPSVQFRRIHIAVTLLEAGRRVEFNENYDAIAQRTMASVIALIHLPGPVLAAEATGVSLSRYSVSPHQERWLMELPTVAEPGAEFSYSLRYSLANAFTSAQSSWSIPIESPTDVLEIVFDFSHTGLPRWCKLFHQIGQTFYEDPAPVIVANGHYSWSVAAPRYRDTYVVVFEWANAA